MFKYKSDLVLSKSWLNRALIIQHYADHQLIRADSDSEDVQALKMALSQIGKTTEFHLGQGGTSFRFFCFLISRQAGEWKVKAHPRLLERPQKELEIILRQLGVSVTFHVDHVLLRSRGWIIPELLICEAQNSSQFVSALLLNSWNLDRDLNIQIQGPIVSEEYLGMTIEMLKSFGLQIDSKFHIPKKQIPKIKNIRPEVDVSSAFSLAAAAVVNGDVEITNWSSQSLQPDLVFLKIFDQMKIKYEETPNSLRIEKQNNWAATKVNLNSSPDLFPVLAVLCALANGTSVLHGAEQLQHKESNRIAKTHELLQKTGFQTELKKDGLVIYGKSSALAHSKPFIFNPDHDHRMAMAAAILKLAGFVIDIQDADVVNKSYPCFWKDIGIQP